MRRIPSRREWSQFSTTSCYTTVKVDPTKTPIIDILNDTHRYKLTFHADGVEYKPVVSTLGLYWNKQFTEKFAGRWAAFVSISITGILSIIRKADGYVIL